MFNLLIIVLLICSSFGAALSKYTNDYGFRKPQRQHTKPLSIDKEVIKA